MDGNLLTLLKYNFNQTNAMKKICLLLFFTSILILGKAQNSEDSVKMIVNQLFKAMKNSDSTLLENCFADSAVLQTIVEKDGKVEIKNEPVSEFASVIKSLPKGAADEQITFDVLKVEGTLAIVWAPYQFYFKGKFSHCGTDSFQLVRINGEWRIQYLIDTRRKAGCRK